MLIIQIMFFARNLLRTSRGQDLIEYALMAGFVAVAAGAIMPGVANSISQIFQNVYYVLACAAGGADFALIEGGACPAN